MIRQDAAMPVSRFCTLIGIPRRTYPRHPARSRAGEPVAKGPWPAPVRESVEPVAAKYAAHRPARGHRKIHARMAVDGHPASASTVERAMRARGLLQPVDYQGERREPDKARKAAFADAPTRPNEVWRADAIEAVRIGIAETERIGGASLASLPPVNPETGEIRRIKLVTDNGGAFARFIASRPKLLHIRTRAKSPSQNGLRERGFGSRKYEHLYRVHEQIATVEDLYREAEAYRAVFNAIRPHETLGFRRPAEILRDPSLHPIHKQQTRDLVPEP